MCKKLCEIIDDTTTTFNDFVLAALPDLVPSKYNRTGYMINVVDKQCDQKFMFEEEKRRATTFVGIEEEEKKIKTRCRN